MRWSTRIRFTLGFGLVAVVAAVLIPSFAAAKPPVKPPNFTASATGTVDSASCSSFSAHGVISWNGSAKVDSFGYELGANNGQGSVGAVYAGPFTVSAGGKSKGSFNYSFSNVNMPAGTDVAVVAKFFIGGVESSTRAFVDLGPCSGQPDLVIGDIRLGTDPQNPYGYTITILNTGNAPVDISGVAIQGYYDPNSGTYPGDTPGCTFVIPAGNPLMQPNDAYTAQVPCQTPPQRNDAWLNVKVDDTNRVAESNENNNVASVALPLPDLVVSNITLGDGGQTTNGYIVTIQNVGAVSVDVNGVAVMGYYGNTSLTWPTGNPACGSSVQSGSPVVLAPGNTQTIHVGCSNDPPPPGNPYLNVKVDIDNLVAESDETNNVASVLVP